MVTQMKIQQLTHSRPLAFATLLLLIQAIPSPSHASMPGLLFENINSITPTCSISGISSSAHSDAASAEICREVSSELKKHFSKPVDILSYTDPRLAESTRLRVDISINVRSLNGKSIAILTGYVWKIKSESRPLNCNIGAVYIDRNSDITSPKVLELARSIASSCIN